MVKRRETLTSFRSWISGKLKPVVFPKFLEPMDRWLLRNHPRVWVTKVPYVIYWAILVNVCVVFVTSAYEFRPPHVDYLSPVLTLVLACVALAVWGYAIRVSFFNIDREHTDRRWHTSGWLLATHILCVAMIASPLPIGTMIVMHRIRTAVPADDLTRAIQFPPQFDVVEGLSPRLCEELVVRYSGELSLDASMVARYSGRSIVTIADAEENYCTALSRAWAVYEVFFSEDGSTEELLYATFALLVSASWLVFVGTAVQVAFSQHMGQIAGLSIGFSLLAAAVLGIGKAIDLPADSVGAISLTTSVCLSCLMLFWLANNVRKLGRFSTWRSAALMLLPPAFGWSVLLLLSRVGLTSAISLPVAAALAFGVSLLPFPYWMSLLSRLAALPEE